jgi:putative transposase
LTRRGPDGNQTYLGRGRSYPHIGAATARFNVGAPAWSKVQATVALIHRPITVQAGRGKPCPYSVAWPTEMQTMTDELHSPNRQSVRLPRFDYRSFGVYFVTVCTKNRYLVLDDPTIIRIILDAWAALPQWFPTIVLDEFVVMSNHVHLLLWLQAIGESVGCVEPAPDSPLSVDVCWTAWTTPAPPQWVVPRTTKTISAPRLGDVIGVFKSLVFNVYSNWAVEHAPGVRAKFWQRNYYEHVVRNESELLSFRRYIRENPANWPMDRDNPQNPSGFDGPTDITGYLADISRCRG